MNEHTPLTAQESLRGELESADTHHPGGQVVTVLREDLRLLLTPAPLSPDVEAAVEYIEKYRCIIHFALLEHIDTLLHAVRAPQADGGAEGGGRNSIP